MSISNFTIIRKRQSTLLLLCSLTTLAVLCFDLLMPLGVAGGVPYVLVVLLSMRFTHSDTPIFVALVCTTLTLLGFYLSPPGGELWVIVTNRALAIIAIWITAMLSRIVMRDYRKDIKILRGLLPICAACKTIQDDHGKWVAIESFIQKQSEAKFSHGLCPDCCQTLYPEYETALRT